MFDPLGEQQPAGWVRAQEVGAAREVWLKT